MNKVFQEELEAQGLVLVTQSAEYDEPCYLLVEMNLLSAEFKDRSRYQLLFVVREVTGPHKEPLQQLAVLSRRLGPVDEYPYPELRVPGGLRDPETGRLDIWDTVGGLINAADQWRNTADLAQARVRELQESSTLITDFLDQLGEAKKIKQNASTHGRYFRRERSGYTPRDGRYG